MQSIKNLSSLEIPALPETTVFLYIELFTYYLNINKILTSKFWVENLTYYV